MAWHISVQFGALFSLPQYAGGGSQWHTQQKSRWHVLCCSERTRFRIQTLWARVNIMRGPPQTGRNMSPSDSSVRMSLVAVGGVQDGTVVPVRTPFLIGRDPGCHLRPASPAVSPHHCAIEGRDGNPVLIDLGSEEGTFINGDRLLLEYPLRDRDELQVGPLRFVVRVDEVCITLEPEDADEVELTPRNEDSSRSRRPHQA